jgi:hypothetical protein
MANIIRIKQMIVIFCKISPPGMSANNTPENAIRTMMKIICMLNDEDAGAAVLRG